MEETFWAGGIEYAMIDGVAEALTPISTLQKYKEQADELNEKARERRALKTLLTQHKLSSLGEGIREIIGEYTEKNLTTPEHIPNVIYFIEKEMAITRSYKDDVMKLNRPVTTFAVKLMNKTENKINSYIDFLDKCVSGLKSIKEDSENGGESTP